MTPPPDPPLDEIQWRSPPLLAQMGGLHSNTVLFYFAESPFFERTSNNAVIMNQAMNNISMYHFIQTRDAFEGRLKTMSGLEFIVGEEPAETGPGMGTGVWVIRKQTRRKRYQDEDEITVHASFFVVGDNIYMAPALAHVLASRMMTISSAIARILPLAQNARKWRPSLGHVYHLPTTSPPSSSAVDQPRDRRPEGPSPEAGTDELLLERASEEAFLTHMRHGGEYIDENPITGRPGDFHLSSTGRRAVPRPQAAAAESAIGTMAGPASQPKAEEKKETKPDKASRSTTMPSRPKRRKSRASNVPSLAQTPAAS